MTVATIGKSCFANSCKINHLGMNPVRGGRPPSERRTRAVVVERRGLLGQVTARVLILVTANVFSVKNSADVIKI